MHKLSLLTVLFAVCLRLGSAQNGYNYDRPDQGLGGGGGRPTGFAPSTGPQAGYPAAATTPSYSAPSFPPNQQPGGGYNYPSQAENDFSAGPAGTTGYPSQRPSTGSGFSSPAAGTGAGQPYPGAQAPSAGSPYPGAQAPNAGSPYPASGQPQTGRPTGPAAAGRPSAPGAQTGFGPAAQGPAQGGFAQGGQSGQGGGSGGSSSSSSQQDDSQEGDYSAIPGEPEIDYPIFSEIPETSFDCNQQEFPGYYADVEARCQVFHICALNKTFDFLCPNGTIFSQEHLVCVWWNQFDCNSAPGLFGNNANIYDNSQTGQQGGQGGQQAQAGPGPVQPGIANDFSGPAAGVSSAPYPAPGRPQTSAPAFGGGATGPSAPYPAGPSSYQPTGPASGAGYPSAQPAAPGYAPPTPTGGAAGYQPTGPAAGAGYPSTQGPYPSAGAAVPPSNVPSSYQPPQGFPPQSEAPYPAAGTPQTPTREYLPPRRG
jgi:hypothetical protein